MATYTTVTSSAPYVVQQQNVVIAADSAHPASTNRKCFKSLGIAQIVIGVIGVLFEIVLYLLLSIFYNGTGLWGGVFYITSGGLSISIGKRAQQGNVIAGLVASVLASIIGFICGLIDALVAVAWARVAFTYNSNYVSVFIGLYAVLSLLEFVQMILAICVSAYCCMGTCGQRNVQGQVIGTHAVMTVPGVQQSYGQQQGYYPQPVGDQVFTNVATPSSPQAPAYSTQPPAYGVENEKI